MIECNKTFIFYFIRFQESFIYQDLFVVNKFFNSSNNLQFRLAKLLNEASENNPPNLVLGIVDMKAVERKAVQIFNYEF
jgi:hypothetical protein